MIIGLLLVGALICFGYYILIILYSGFGTSAALVWLLAAFTLVGLAAGIRFYERHPERLPLWLPVSVITLLASGLVVLISVTGLIFTNVPALAVPGLDYVIVLGAKVETDGLSGSLQRRLDKAAEYMAENPDTVLILSGGQGDDEPTSEAEAMYRYLKDKGVPDQQMLLEISSRNTAENIAYSQILMEQHREGLKNSQGAPVLPDEQVVLVAPDRPLQVGIITNNFHLYRAGLIARKRGLDNVSGIAAGSDPVLLLHMSVRECIAILKDRLLGNI